MTGNEQSDVLNEKVLLRERKRHTARHVVSTPSVVLPGYPPGGVPGQVPPEGGGQAPPRGRGVPSQVPRGVPGQVPPGGYPVRYPLLPHGILGNVAKHYGIWVPPGGVPGQVPRGVSGQVPPRGVPSQVPPPLPHGILGNVAKHYGIWVPPRGVPGQVPPRGGTQSGTRGGSQSGTPPGVPGQVPPPGTWPGTPRGGTRLGTPPAAPWHSGKCCKALWDMGTPPVDRQMDGWKDRRVSKHYLPVVLRTRAVKRKKISFASWMTDNIQYLFTLRLGWITALLTHVRLGGYWQWNPFNCH